ncbi:MAG: aminotransferase class III-fold pyridoxal phosphate-dependent enzyme [Candidatus Omnitrophica bacterium]|nr:aminotransferase class III-fold pyridoxal phosphate-dependent enzyme [Candidatus Omnitrophota bacterium]
MKKKKYPGHSYPLFAEASAVLPRPANHLPTLIKYTRGSRIYDFDNNAFTDYTLGQGAIILGHNNRIAALAAKKAADQGIFFSSFSRDTVSLAKEIKKHFPAIEKIQLTSSEEKARRLAMTLARMNRKKELIVSLDQASPLNSSSNILHLPWGDWNAVTLELRRHAAALAAIILTPVAFTRQGFASVDSNFLNTLTTLSREHGFYIIFDEIATGFREGLGGWQTAHHFQPDLTCLGRIIGGGFSLGAVGGKAEILDAFVLPGIPNPVVAKTGLAILRQLTPPVYAKLNTTAENFTAALNSFWEEKKMLPRLTRFGSMLGFIPETIDDNEYAAFVARAWTNNIILPAKAAEPFYFSLSHTRAEIQTLKQTLQSAALV